MAVMRTHMRALQINKEPNEAVLKELGLTKQDVEDMYRLLAIAKYKDRFVIPTSHREQVADFIQRTRKLWFIIHRWSRLQRQFLK